MMNQQCGSRCGAVRDNSLPVMVEVEAQTPGTTYCPNRALKNGTLFPVLFKPMNGEMHEEPGNMDRKQANSFALWELRLYLDTHPEDKEALALLRQLDSQTCQPNYATSFVPCVSACNTENQTSRCGWCWLDHPWPWEKECCQHPCLENDENSPRRRCCRNGGTWNWSWNVTRSSGCGNQCNNDGDNCRDRQRCNDCDCNDDCDNCNTRQRCNDCDCDNDCDNCRTRQRCNECDCNDDCDNCNTRQRCNDCDCDNDCDNCNTRQRCNDCDCDDDCDNHNTRQRCNDCDCNDDCDNCNTRQRCNDCDCNDDCDNCNTRQRCNDCDCDDDCDNRNTRQRCNDCDCNDDCDNCNTRQRCNDCDWNNGCDNRNTRLRCNDCDCDNCRTRQRCNDCDCDNDCDNCRTRQRCNDCNTCRTRQRNTRCCERDTLRYGIIDDPAAQAARANNQTTFQIIDRPCNR